MSLLLALIMVFSLVVPAAAADAADEKLPATQQDAVIAVLRDAGMEDSQLSTAEYGSEQFAYDCTELAKSMGILPANYNASAACTAEMYSALTKAAQPLYQALHADKLQPLFMNGMAQPIFPYTSGVLEEGSTYSNADSDIIRFFVYVETNYDTDGDGKLDLVKALVQMPRAAMEGDYKAATIYEARPYITGCTDRSNPLVEGGYDIDSMYNQPAKRVAAGTTTTAEVAANADASEWYYWNPFEEMYDYEDLTWYDYYLVRGYAVVECGGLGTKDSEGFETCGTDLEIDAFKCVIEWLHGDRVAYTDKTSNIAISADWSNGKVGMTGRSYAGTTQFGLATTGVEGLETIVPVAGIASWYEYTNSQGVATRSDPAYSEWLAAYCAGRYLDEDDYATIEESYGKYLQQIRDLQLELNGDYGEHWAIRDYTGEPLLDWAGIQIPALIVHGLNDTNVRTKESDLMYDAFTKAGQNVKLLWHQGTHLTPTYPSQEYELKINGEYYDSILNKWFSHYLYNVDNGIENMANVTVQSNVDGSWDTYDSWETAENVVLKTSASTSAATSAVTPTEGYYENPERNSGWTETKAGTTASYTFSVANDMTIQGPVAVHLRMAASAENFDELDGVRVTVGLNDTNSTEFNAYVPEKSYLPLTTVKEDGAWMGGGVSNFRLVQYAQTPTTSKSIGLGYIDVFNPEAGYMSNTATRRAERIQEGQYYDYVVYIQPTVYTVKAGHTLELTVSIANNSGVNLTIDNTATYADLPVRRFADVSNTDWYAKAVDYVNDKNLMVGDSNTTFGANGTTTRGMIVTILYRMENQPSVNASNFTDVAAGQYYANAVAWATENGIVSGYGDGRFGPNDAITREQFASILFRYAQYKGLNVETSQDKLSQFGDEAQISGYAATALNWAVNKGILSGMGNNSLNPQGNATRAQTAQILMTYCEKVAK